MKKILLHFLLALVTFALPSVSRADSVVMIGSLYYALSTEAKTATVAGTTYATESANKDYDGTDLTIPADVTYEDVTYSVTKVDNNAFANNATLTAVTIPLSVTTIGDGAFGSCTALTKIMMMPETPPAIGTSAVKADAKIYVPYTGFDTYKEKWGDTYTFIPMAVFNAGNNVKSIKSVSYDEEHNWTYVKVVPKSNFAYTYNNVKRVSSVVTDSNSSYFYTGKNSEYYYNEEGADGVITLIVSYTKQASYQINLKDKAYFKTSDSSKGTITAVRWDSPSQATLTLNFAYGWLYYNVTYADIDWGTSDVKLNGNELTISKISKDAVHTHVVNFKSKCSFEAGAHLSSIASVKWTGESSAEVTCTPEDYGYIYYNRNWSYWTTGVGFGYENTEATGSGNVVTFTGLGTHITYRINFGAKATFESWDESTGTISSIVWTAENEATVTVSPAEGYQLSKVHSNRINGNTYLEAEVGATEVHITEIRDFEWIHFIFEKKDAASLSQSENDGISISVRGGDIAVSGTDDFEVYSISGRKVAPRGLAPGLYIVRTDGASKRVVVK